MVDVRAATVSWAGRTVAVTGASGFVGGYVCRDLIARGVTVRAVCRRLDAARWVEAFGGAVRWADLRDADAVSAALDGADAVISCAALTPRQGGSDEDFEAVNLDGLMHLARAAHAHGVRRFVHVGSAAEVRTRLTREMTEGDPMVGDVDSLFDLSSWVTRPIYSTTKAEGEQLLWEAAPHLGLQVTVLRPATIYGPGVARLNEVYRWALRQPLVPAPTIRFGHVHVEDVSAAIVAALERPGSIGHTYNLGGEVVSPCRFLTTLVELLGEGPRVLPLPLPFAVEYDDHAARHDLGFYSRPIREGAPDALKTWVPPTPATLETP